MLKNQAKKSEKLKIFIFRKIAPNSFYRSEIGPKATCDPWRVIRNSFWPPTCISNDFSKIEFPSSKSTFCLLALEKAWNSSFSWASEYGRGILNMSFPGHPLCVSNYSPRVADCFGTDFRPIEWIWSDFTKNEKFEFFNFFAWFLSIFYA